MADEKDESTADSDRKAEADGENDDGTRGLVDSFRTASYGVFAARALERVSAPHVAALSAVLNGAPTGLIPALNTVIAAYGVTLPIGTVWPLTPLHSRVEEAISNALHKCKMAVINCPSPSNWEEAAAYRDRPDNDPEIPFPIPMTMADDTKAAAAAGGALSAGPYSADFCRMRRQSQR
jgi:hypothetical protein